MIVSYASAAGRRVVFADANPGLLALPAATLRTLEEARQALRGAAGGAARAVRGDPVVPDGPVAGKSLMFGEGPVVPAAPRPDGPSWAGPVPPPSRDPAGAPISWREDGGPPPNLGPPPEPLDWRRHED